MQAITIKGTKRESVGKKATKALRNAEQVPCVIYGKGNTLHFTAPEKNFKKLIYTPNVYTAEIELEDGKKINAILQDVQFHPVTDKILHIDFYQLFPDKEVTMTIPVRLEGVAPGIIKGGALRFTNRKLKVKALPANLPDEIVATISGLDIGDKLYVRDLKNDKYTIMHPDNVVVVQVRMARTASKTVGDEEAGEAGETEAATEA
ncbi:MAG TPA: 50S ribosomal protein L25/general stress protein Ctc [Flavobacteriia bacterium]|nr:50S ribosomal protein L25/general stress protein Ctc [Flavobacteriia bacterium]